MMLQKLLRTYQPSENSICSQKLTQPSFMEDTTDLVNKIQELNKQGPFSNGTLLVSWDVVSMFPTFDNELGLGGVKRALDLRDQLMPSTNCILEALEMCLKSNHSVFNEKFYLQIHGTAMAPKNASSFGDLAMVEIDWKAKFGGPLKRPHNGGDIMMTSFICGNKVFLH